MRAHRLLKPLSYFILPALIALTIYGAPAREIALPEKMAGPWSTTIDVFRSNGALWYQEDLILKFEPAHDDGFSIRFIAPAAKGKGTFDDRGRFRQSTRALVLTETNGSEMSKVVTTGKWKQRGRTLVLRGKRKITTETGEKWTEKFTQRFIVKGKRLFRIDKISGNPPTKIVFRKGKRRTANGRGGATDPGISKILAVSPAPNDFGVSPTTQVLIAIDNVAAIDPSTLVLSVGNQVVTRSSNPPLTFVGNQARFTPATALGSPAQTIQAEITCQDYSGRIHSLSWEFELARTPEVAPNVTVFGSPQTQASGQALSPAATAVAARAAFPPATAKAVLAPGTSWELTSISANEIEISYTGTPPVFAVDGLICNGAPPTANEIFYRRITAISDNGVGTITLTTVDVPLTDFIINGSLHLTGDGFIVLDSTVASSSALLPPNTKHSALLGSFDLSGSFGWDAGTFGEIYRDVTLADVGVARASLAEAGYEISPYLRVSFDIEDSQLERLTAMAAAGVRASLIPRLQYSASSSLSDSRELHNRDVFRLIGFIGIVPIWIELDFTLTANLAATISGSGDFRTGFSRRGSLRTSVTYIRGIEPIWTSSARGTLFEEALGFDSSEYQVDGDGTIDLGLEGRLDVLLDSLAGVFVSTEPTVGTTTKWKIENGDLEGIIWENHAFARLSAGLSIAFTTIDNGFPKADLSLFERNWCEASPNPAPEELIISPIELSDRSGIHLGPDGPSRGISYPGEYVGDLFVDVCPIQDATYQWFDAIGAIPGETNSSYRLPPRDQRRTGDAPARIHVEISTSDEEFAEPFREEGPTGPGDGGSGGGDTG